MVVKARVTAAFRKLVALLARAFYAGECPPKSAEDEAAAAKSSRAKQQVLTSCANQFRNLNMPAQALLHTGHHSRPSHPGSRRPLRHRPGWKVC